MKSIILLIIGILMLPFAFADTLIINEYVSDNEVQAGDPDTVFATGQHIGPNSGTGSDNFKRGYFCANLTNASSTLSGKVIDDAQFWILEPGNPAGGTLYIHEVLIQYGGANESTMTWNNQPCGTGTPPADSLRCNITEEDNHIHSDGPVQFNLTMVGMFRKALSESRDTMCVMLKTAEDNANKDVAIQSKEDVVPSSRWKINVTFSEPVADTTAPTITEFSINDTSIFLDEDVLVSGLLTDETELDMWRIAHNVSGTMTNQTLNDISGASLNATYTFTDSIAKHNVITYQFWTNDTSNNAQTSSVFTFTILNTPPATPTIVYPTADLRTNEQPLDMQVTFPSDEDGDAITILYYINDSLNVSSVSNTTLEASDGYYTLKVSLTDGEEFSANTSVDFEIDTVNPILTIISPTATSYDTNITANVTCTDSNPFILNYTFINSTFDVVKSTQDSTAPLSIEETIDIDNIADGVYNFTARCSDSHTDIVIDDYYVTYTLNGIMYDTAEGNRIKIQQVGKPATPSTSKKIDRYEFYFGTAEEQEIRTYKVISTWNDIIILDSSEYNAHMVVWNGEDGNWIDFESSDGEIIGVNRINPRHVEVFVRGTDFNFKSIGGLNVVTETVLLTIDRAVVTPVADEEDAVLTAIILIGSVALIIGVLIVVFMNVKNSFKGIRK